MAEGGADAPGSGMSAGPAKAHHIVPFPVGGATTGSTDETALRPTMPSLEASSGGSSMAIPEDADVGLVASPITADDAQASAGVAPGGEVHGDLGLPKVKRDDEDPLPNLDVAWWQRRPMLMTPEETFRKYWDLVIMLVIWYSVIVVPYRLGFGRNATGFMKYMDYVFDILFGLDICFNFITAYEDTETLEMIYTHRDIAWNYIYGWFTIDFFSTVPFDLLGQAFGANNPSQLRTTKLLRTLRLFKLVRMLRLFKLAKLKDQAAEALNVNAKYFLLVGLVFVQFFCAHMMACVWFGIAQPPAEEEGFTTWDQHLTWVYAKGLMYADADLQYTNALYWAFATMTTVGYGDILPISDTERFVAIWAMIVGVTVFGYTLLLVALVLIDGDPREAAVKRKMNMLSEFLADKQFPKKLGRRIRGHFKSLFHEREDLFEHTGMFDFLHPMLQTSVRVSCNTHWPSAVEAIATLEPPLRARMFECIRPCNFERDELLYSPGEIATQIYFCVRGTVLISIQLPKEAGLTPEGEFKLQVIAQHKDSGCFGLTSTLRGQGIRLCQAQVKNCNRCYLAFLDRNEFNWMASEWPRLRQSFLQLAKEEKSMMRKALRVIKKKLALEDNGGGLDGIEEEAEEDGDGDGASSSDDLPPPAAAAKIEINKVRSRRPMSVETKQRVAEAAAAASAASADDGAAAAAAATPAAAPTAAPAAAPPATAPPVAAPAATAATPAPVPEGQPAAAADPPAPPTPPPASASTATATATPPAPAAAPAADQSSAAAASASAATAPASAATSAEGVSIELTPMGASKAAAGESKDGASATKRMGKRQVSDEDKDRLAVARRRSSSMILLGLDEEEAHPPGKIPVEVGDDTAGVSEADQVWKNAQILRMEHYLIHPKYPPKIVWDLIVAALIIYSVWTVPFRIGYGVEPSQGEFVFDVFIDIMFGFDIIAAFRCTYLDDEGYYVTDNRRIAIGYLSGWFIIDFGSTLPVDHIVTAAQPSGQESGQSTVRLLKLLRVLRLARLLKLVRLLKLKKFLGNYAEAFEMPPAVSDFFKNFALMLFVTHLYSCVWYYVASSRQPEQDNWIDQYCAGADEYQWCMRDHTDSTWHRYVASMYFVIATFATVGYGDVYAQSTNRGEMVVAMFGMCMGTIVFAMFIASVYTVVSSKEVKKEAFRDLKVRLRDYMTEQGISNKLQAAVRRQLLFFMEAKNPFYNQREMLSEMPSSLCNQAVRFDQKHKLLAMQIFMHLESKFPGAAHQFLNNLGQIFVGANDAIIGVGETMSNVFFVYRGEVLVVDEHNNVVSIVQRGGFFGEGVLAVPAHCPFTFKRAAVARRNCILYTLSRRKYMVLASVCPAMMELFYEMLRPADGLDEWLDIEDKHKEDVANFNKEGAASGEQDELIIRLTRTASTEEIIKATKKRQDGSTFGDMKPKIKRSISKGLKKKYDLEIRDGWQN